MGLFSRNKGTEAPPRRGRSPPPPPAPIPLYEPSEPQPRPPVVHPPSGLSTASPQPQPSPAQFQQQLFHQTYQVLHNQQHPQQQPPLLHQAAIAPGAANLAYPQLQQLYGLQQQKQHNAAAATAAAAAAASGVATGTAQIAGGDGAMSTALLRQAVQAAAREGRPLALNFVAQMQPVMADHPYGVAIPHQHPYGPPLPDGVALPPPSEDWRPGLGQDPYEAIRIPALPDMRDMPVELQDFRDQCATGVRQAVAMITAMEHQLWWERSRRQQAEEDCKVLLAAVRMERGVGDELLGAEERRRVQAAEAASKLTLAADELPQANEAATTIQKNVRGHLARKEFESHLRDILRGVDPSLDPAALPAAAQSHVSHVNAQRLGLRTLLGGVPPPQAAGGNGAPPGSSHSERVEATAYYRRQVDLIGLRLAGHKDAGLPHPGDTSGDPLQADVKQLLSGSYPASSAQVIAALVRRCRELQAALLESVGELQQAKLAIEGLKTTNDKVAELSGVRSELEAARQDNVRLVAMVAKLRTALGVRHSAGAGEGGAVENPYVAAWYRKAYADREWQRVPPGGPGGVALLDGPDSAVETWDDLRASVPEPIMVPRVAVPGAHHRDLMALKEDMILEAAQGPPDPLYTMPVPDRSGFVYERDTPLVPVQSPVGIIRESVPPDRHLSAPAAAAVYRQYQQQQAAAASGGGAAHLHPPPPHQHQQQFQQQAGVVIAAAVEAGGVGTAGSYGGGGADATSSGRRSFRYHRDTPVVPVYSVLPLIREDDFFRRSTSPQREATMMPPATPPLQQQQQQQQQPPQQRQRQQPPLQHATPWTNLQPPA